MGPHAPRAAHRLPTEGCLDIREYRQGDDVRRIHWVRSLSRGELIVRLPDEIPPDRPRVRVVLDTFFPEAFALTSHAPAELLDWLVGVWLAVGRAIAESGARVTLVAAFPDGDTVVKTVRHDLSLRATGAALELGARVAWQNRMTVDQLLTDEATFVITRCMLAQPPAQPKHRWVLAAPPIPTDIPTRLPSAARVPHPMGSSENRWGQRRRAIDALALARFDHARAFKAMRLDAVPPPPKSFTAGPSPDGGIRLELLQ